MLKSHSVSQQPVRNQERTHEILREMSNSIATRNVRMLRIGLKNMLRVLDCPRQKTSTDESILEEVCNIILKMMDLINGLEPDHTDGPEIDLRLAGVKVMRWKLMKKLGMDDEAINEIPEEELTTEEERYLRADEYKLNAQTRQKIVEERKFAEQYYYNEIIPDIDRSRELPGCRKFDEEFLAARDEFVKKLNTIYDHYFSRDATDFHGKLNYVDRVEQVLLDFKEIAPYEKMYAILCEDALKLRKMLAYGIILLESDYDAEAEIKSVLRDVRLHIHLMNHGLDRLEFYLEDDFLEPDSEKCADYYYQEYVAEREKQRRDLQFDLDFYGDEFDNRPPF